RGAHCQDRAGGRRAAPRQGDGRDRRPVHETGELMLAWRTPMPRRSPIGAVALATGLLMSAGAQAFDDSKYPALNGQWSRAHPRSQWDPSKPRGLQQQAPLTPEYQAVFEANLKALHSGNLGTDPQVHCLPSGMPRMMIAYEPMDVIVTPETTYI